MKKRLAILGCGGHGAVVADIATVIGGWEEIVFFDDRFEKTRQVFGFPVLEALNGVFANETDGYEFFVALGDATLRLQWISKLQISGKHLVTLIHPSTSVSKRSSIGKATLLKPYSVVDAGVSIGQGCIINSGSTISHGCTIGDGVHICPGVNIAGDVSVGNQTWVGIGASTIQGVKIGEKTIIGAGAIIVDDIPDNVTVVGNPARIIKRHGK